MIIIYNGLAFRIWPNVNLKARFIISYALASIVPLSLLCVTSYGYILKYEKTAEEQAINKLQKSLKEFDAYKLSIIKDYRTAFTKIIKDPKLIELIRNNDINNNIITKTAVKIFENKEDKNNYLPILGIKIYDEIGEGSLASGTTFTNLDTNTIFDSFDSTMVNLLRDEIKKENKGINLKEYKPNQEKEFANDAYKSLSNRDLKNDIY
ncbi:MAG: hypothetical protein J6Z11_10710, partial [Candidatus Riflebacteria bacterium]|nr:hypothetical protein [Candidatus Riflebacteria bacterium]